MKNKAPAPPARRLFVPELVAAASAALFFVFASPAMAGERAVLQSGHVPAVVKQMLPLDHLPASQQLRLAIGLPLRNQTALTNLMQQIYDPASPNYHRYLSTEQFTEMFGPSEEDYRVVIAFARTNGLTVSATHSNRVVLDVTGSVADVEKAFQVTMYLYQHSRENRTFFAPDVEPSVPSGIQILDVSGLDNYILPHPKYRLPPANTSPNATPKIGSAPGGNYMGYDFRAAYAPGVSLTGTGQTVALLQFDGYYASDITAYANLAGLPGVPLQNVLLDGFDGTPTGSGGEVEVSLDIEMVISMAPELTKVMLYMAGPSGIPNDILSRMASDNEARQISCSWGWGGGPQATTEQIFLQMAAQGQTFFNATGDGDAFLKGQVDDPSFTGSPSSSPNITQVGGTTLTTSGPGGSWLSETVWNWGGGSGSSGGISSVYSIPAWQMGIDMTANKGSTTYRNIPDVALTGDNVYVIADNGIAYPGTGGTSCAAPLWAGFAALINEQAAKNGIAPVGFLNPALYTIGKSFTGDQSFHDIVTGDNTWSGSPNLFFAVPGYDLCAGWGTPNGPGLINALAGGATRNGFLQTSVNPPSGAAIISASVQPVYVTVSDGGGVTNAAVLAYINGSSDPGFVFRNDGVAPDVGTNDSVYSGQFTVPSNASSVTVTLVTTAPGEIGVTNVLNYTIVSSPSNDNFANATKVPVDGAAYLSNNRFATLEPGEPSHAGDTNAAASLWWIWSPTNSGNVLIDTTGSAIDTVLAVYTGQVLSNLTQVAAANNVGAQQQAYFNFNAISGTAYRIALASANTNSVGSFQLRIAPGGQLDTTLPQISIAFPHSGLSVSSRIISITGTAGDPAPNASGVQQVVVYINGDISGSAVGTTSWSANVALNRTGVNLVEVRALDAAGNSSPAAAVQVYYIPNSGNDLFANAIELSGNSGNDSVSNANASKEFGEPEIAGNAGGHSVWWSFTPPTDGILSLVTSNSTFDTLLGLYQGSRVTNLTSIAENDDAYAGSGFSKISQAVQGNVPYHISVDGYGGATGVVFLAYSFAPSPIFSLSVTAMAGGTVTPGSGAFVANSPVVLVAAPSPGYEFVGWQGGVVSSDNPLSIILAGDTSLTASFQPIPVTDGFESGNLLALPWTTSGGAPWIVQTQVVASGQYAARSGVITNNQFSDLSLSINSAGGIGSFDYKVSSETTWDVLAFSINGVAQQTWSGEAGWATYQFQMPAGLVRLEWRYSKDASTSAGSDAAFLDNLDLPLATTSLQLANPTATGFQIQLQGQANQTVLVQFSTDLATWRTESTNVVAGSSLQYVYSNPSANQARFYRVVIP